MHQIINFFNPWYQVKPNTDTMPYYLKKFIPLPFYVFIICFFIGTSLMVACIATHKNDTMMAAYLFTGVALCINLIVLIIFIGVSCYHKKHALFILQKTSVLLINIPVTVFYFILIVQSLRNQ